MSVVHIHISPFLIVDIFMDHNIVLSSNKLFTMELVQFMSFYKFNNHIVWHILVNWVVLEMLDLLYF